MTDTAAKQLRRLLGNAESSNKALRVYVTPGGCSGFSYGMELDDQGADDDATFTIEGLPVRVDQFSLQYLDGAQIDYTNALMGGGFTVQNPNATKTCSCGQSFDTPGGGGTARPCGA